MLDGLFKIREGYPPRWVRKDTTPCKGCGIAHFFSLALGVKTAKGSQNMYLVSLCPSCLAEVALNRIKKLKEGVL